MRAPPNASETRVPVIACGWLGMLGRHAVVEGTGKRSTSFPYRAAFGGSDRKAARSSGITTVFNPLRLCTFSALT